MINTTTIGLNPVFRRWSFLLLSLLSTLGYAVPAFLGDLNEDNELDVRDIVLLVNHLQQKEYLDATAVQYADANADGTVNSLDVEAMADRILKRKPLEAFPLARILGFTAIED